MLFDVSHGALTPGPVWFSAGPLLGPGWMCGGGRGLLSHLEAACGTEGVEDGGRRLVYIGIQMCKGHVCSRTGWSDGVSQLRRWATRGEDPW